jgi:hypothetical protein
MSTAFVARDKVVRKDYTNQLDLFGSMASDVAVSFASSFGMTLLGEMNLLLGANTPGDGEGPGPGKGY